MISSLTANLFPPQSPSRCSTIYIRPPLCVAVLLLLLALAASAAPDPVRSALLCALIPGGGHLYLHEYSTAAGYAGSIGALAAAGLWLDQRNQDLDRDKEVNSFYLLSLKEWELSLFTTYRNAHRHAGYNLAAAGLDDTPTAQLFTAPFQPRNLADPAVLAAAGIALGLVAAASTHEDRRFNDISRVGLLGSTFNRHQGLALYGGDAFGLSLGAAVGEEALWRGVLQNELESAYGPRGGLYASAALFGLAHLVDLDGSISPGRAAFGTLAGWYLGTLFQQDRHRLSRAIAAHFWYDFTVMLAGFLLDPDENALNVRVTFRY